MPNNWRTKQAFISQVIWYLNDFQRISFRTFLFIVSETLAPYSLDLISSDFKTNQSAHFSSKLIYVQIFIH